MGTAEGGTAAEMVDWQLATGVARKLLRPGPAATRAEADQVVSELRQFALDSERHVRDFTGLRATAATAPVVIVDRPGWVQANADGFRIVLQPLADKIREKQHRSGGLSSVVGSRVTAFEAGALLAFLSSRVLGQFDPFYPSVPDPLRPGLTGRLLLVAPNVMHVESELGVVPRDFRLWVCLHEETHRVQFTAVPWLRDHLRSEIALFLDNTELDASAYAAMFREAVQRLGRSIKGEGELSLVDLMQSPEQRAVLNRLTAVMSLLEGHADFVMDGVGPAVIPTVDTIRAKFTSRRAGGTPLDQVLKRLLGLDAKLRQYQDGAAFVRRVVDRIGMEGFNRVWTGPNTLPTKDEIANPDAWINRLHG
jgi:coenzyme F420 biosynthesis associated uncharacterized protein